jgi:autotransporter-associated beta strand protein
LNAAQLTLNGGTLNTTATFAIDDTNRGVTIGASGGTFNTNASTTLTVASIIAGSGGLVKMGTGTLINSGAGFNSHTGPITVSEGILRFAKTAAVGAIDNIAAVSVASGASLQFDNASLYTIETMGNISGAGTIESIGAAPINLKVNNDNLSSTFSGQINSTNNGGLELWKMGTGNLILSNTTSNYSGQTEIQAGTLTISSIGNLGVASSVGAPTSVANGTIAMGLTSAATLAYTGTGHSTNRVIDLAGTTSGATLDASGSGALVFTSAFTATGAGSKTLTLTGTSTAANTIQGAIVNNSGANTTSLVKNGAGTWTLSGTNSYTGTTTINAGTLAISSEANLGANPGAFNAAQLTLNGGTLNTTATFAIDDSNRGITIGASGGTINTDPSTTLTVANPMAGSGNLTKSGTGNIVLSASSTSFTGAVTIDAGTATLSHSNAIGGGTANTTVTNGAALTLQGGIGISKGTLYLSGTGVSNSGALVSATGNNSWNGNITLNGNTTIKTNSAGVDYLDLGTFQPLLTRPPVDATTTSLGSHTLTLAGGTGTSEIYLNGRITGTGGLTVNMTNTGDKVFLSSHLNTFTGTTEIKNGTLVPATLPNTYPFDNSGGGGTDQYYGLNGPITIGDGTGAANSAVLSIRNSGTRYQELINHTVPITLYKDGLFEVGSAQSIGSTDGGINPLGQSLIFNGGNVSIGTNGLLYLAGDVKVNATAGQTAVIDGVGNTLSLTIQKGVLNNPPNADRVFDVVGGVGNTSDLTINATIKNGSITKNGAGTMTITGNNAAGYEGTTTINNGIVAITNNGSLGQGLTNNASATVVNSGGTLQLSNSITVSNEWLRLNGNGFNSNGALLNLSGTNTWAGSVFLDSDARVQSDAGLLTLSGTTTSSTNANLDVRGSGNTTISGAIGTGSGGVTKNGTGTLTLSGVNTYSGATTVNQGVLSLQSSSGLGAAGTGTTVGNSAELQLDNTAIGGGSNVLTTLAEPLTITGSGVTGQGALRSVSGPNVFAGQVTINTGGATVTANNAHSLTLSGGTTSSNQNLTVGTGAENGNVTISGNMTNGTGSLIKAGTGSLTIASGSTQSATVGQVQLNAGTITVGGGGGNSTLNATDFDSAGSTTLTIASGGLVNVTQAAGTTSTFAGAMAGSGEFKFNGTANFGTPASSSILALSSPFTASSLTLTLNGGLLSLSGVGQYEFGTIHITGNTILDFNNSAGTWLRSAALVIDGGVTITVRNWTATAGLPGSSTVWYATSTINAGSLGAPPTNQVGGTPLNQITFAGWNATDYPTTWVNTAQNGWFDREIRPTPEPSTYGALLLSGCLGLLGWRRLRARKKTAA